MNRFLLSTAFISVLAAGCGHTGLEVHARAGLDHGTSKSASEKPSAGEDGAFAPGAERASGEAILAESGAGDARRPGDYVSYRFSGSFRKAPLTLTQRVIAREGDVLVVDMTLEGGKATETLRVRMSDAQSTRGEIVAAAWVEGDGERPATISAYEAMMAKTALAADANEEVLGNEAVTLAIGGAPLPCQKTSYRVRIGKTRATMNTLQSDGFAWGDVGGDITAEDGRVLYRAEVIDAGHGDAKAGKSANSVGATPAAATVAQSDYDE